MKHVLLLIIVILLASFVRFYNFENRITYGSEQARSLTVAAEYIKTKPSLLGQEYFRTTSDGRKLFSGAVFSYSLVPLLVVFSYNPFPITTFFTFLNIFTGVILYLLFRDMTNKKIALIAMTLFLFSDLMISHSLFIWIMNYSPLVGVLLVYALYRFYKSKHYAWALISGIVSGIGFSLQYLFVIAIIPVIFVLLYKNSKVIKTLLVFAIGMIIGNLPMVLFDLRHEFYHLRTLIAFTRDTFSGSGSGNFAMYQFLHFIPIITLIGAIIVNKFGKRNSIFIAVFLVVYSALNIYSPRVSFSAAVGMPFDLSYADVMEAADAIAFENPDNYNVVSLIDFDTRGYILRYPLTYMYDNPPNDILDYRSVRAVYALAPNTYDFSKPPWELQEFGVIEVEKLKAINNNVSLFILNHDQEKN